MSDQEKDKLVQQLKDALVAIRKLKADLRDERLRNNEPLAIIGMAMRFPGGVRSAGDYWNLLANGVDAITDIPADRFNARELYDPELSTTGRINVLQGGFIDEVDRFDGSFFDITPVEIESMDPQQRILLELVHEAMENSGLNVQKMVGSNTGVYIGIGSNDYQVRHFHSGDYNLVNPYSYTGSAGCAIAGRISYMMGFEGPGMSIDTACSASIIAAHVGSSALRNRECDMAVIGGVNLMLSPEMTICFSNLRALSPDSRCKTFDNSANGYVRSEGCGVIILKRLSDAQRDGDNVLAVIKGSAANQDGRSNGFTAPNVKAQAELIRKALSNAGLQPEEIDYIEAHGTGTRIGDPIEVEAIANVFRGHKTMEDPLILGSVKSNVGHLESAAGMASMIKAVLSLQHGQVPQSIHFRDPNELIDWKNIPIRISTGLTPFRRSSANIGISGFGITGTNGHIIIGHAPESPGAEAAAAPDIKAAKDVLLLPLSARSPEALSALAASYGEFIRESRYSAEDISSFTALRRAQFEHRKLFAAGDKGSLVEMLKEFSEQKPSAAKMLDPDLPVRKVFVFTGQGAQWAGMGMALAERDGVFRRALEECNQALKKYVDWDVFQELAKDEASGRLNEGDVMQPLLMAVGIALARWWMSRGIAPDSVTGHSMGEVAAAHIGGHISLDEAARIITSRSRLMEQQAGKGLMLATDLTAEESGERIKGYGGRLTVSVMNSPSTTVIGGESEAVEELKTALESEERWCRMVRMTVAAHTAQMDPVLEPLKKELDTLKPVNGPVLFYSTSQDKEMKGSELNAEYWVRNVRNSVKFGAAIRHLCRAENTVFIEIGPHSILAAAIEENIQTEGMAERSGLVSSFYRQKDEVMDLHRNLGELYRMGIDLDWSLMHASPSGFIQLPTYPWQRERYWYDQQPSFRSVATAAAPAAGSYFVYEWQGTDLPAKGPSQRILAIHSGGKRDKAQAAAVAASLAGIGHHSETTGPQDWSFDEGVYDTVLLFNSPEGRKSLMDMDENIKPCLLLADIVKHITSSGWKKVPRVVLLTLGVYTGGREEALAPDPAGAMLWGMSRTVRNEYPELTVLAIDANNPGESTVAGIIALGSAGEYRAEGVNVTEPRLTSWKGNAAAVRSAGIRPEACFLVTGGTSGLGLAFAEWLAKQGVVRIALLSRSGMKPETAAAMARMAHSGAEVRAFKGDVSDSEGLTELIASIEVSLGRISGVVHAAGLVDDGTIGSLTAGQFKSVSVPKVLGAWNLNQVLKKNSLSHFIVFSSAAAVLGTIGQANYNAANFYLDRLMDWRAGQGLPATSVCWGNIGGVGMAAAQENRGGRFSEMGFYPIEPTEFDTYFKEVFHAAVPQLIPMKIDFGNWSAHHPAMSRDRTFSAVLQGKAEAKDSQSDADWGSSMAVAKRKLSELVKKHLTAITGIPTAKLKDDETFKSMGLDSMMALQLRNKIQEDAQLKLAVSSIWAHPTVEKYSVFLTAELGLEQKFSGEGKTEGAAFTMHQLKEMVRSGVADITKLPAGRIRETDTFKSMGIDSMQALQIRNALQAKTGITLAASSIWAHPTVEKYTAFLAGELGLGKAPQAAAPEKPPVSEAASGAITSEVEDLSLDELMKQLEEKSRDR